MSNDVLNIYTGRDDIPKNLHGVCEGCIHNARDKYNEFTSDSATYYEDGFGVQCSYIPPDEVFFPAKLKKSIPPEDFNQINSLKSALLWGEQNLLNPDNGKPWRAWSYQRGPLLCPCPRKCYRFGRRTGKTTLLSVEILWYLFTSCGGTLRDPDTKKIRKNLKVLLLAPQKSHIENVFDRIRAFLNLSPALSNCIDRNKRGSPQIISLLGEGQLGGGNMLSGFASGDSSGNKGLAARGQDADLVVMDEGAFVSKEVIENVINPILYTRPTTRFIISSTPSGIANDYFENICTKRPDFAEFYVPATSHPNWAEMEDQVKKDFGSSQEEWDKEVLAKFSPAGIGVYRGDLVKLAQHKYTYGQMLPNASQIFTIGVDWNKEHGTEIVVIATDKKAPHSSYVVWAENISKKEFTTPSGIGRIVELNRMWQPSWIYVDAGGGDGGQMLRYHGRAMAGKNPVDARLMNIVKSYDFASKIEFQEHDGRKVKAAAKQFMVENSVKRFELGAIKYPREDLSITRQLNNYIVARRTPVGAPVFGMKEKKWGDHRLDAMNLALVAVRLQFPSMFNESLAPLGNPIAVIPNEEATPPVERVVLPQSVNLLNAGQNHSRDWRKPNPNARGGVLQSWGGDPTAGNSRFPRSSRSKLFRR